MSSSCMSISPHHHHDHHHQQQQQNHRRRSPPRKRMRKNGSNDFFRSSSSLSLSSSSSSLLSGYVICLSGFTVDVKNKYHALITSLGGQFTRTLNVETTTHLICATPEGDKYEVALQYSGSNNRSSNSATNNARNNTMICIVSAEWLLETAKTKQICDETEYCMASSSASPSAAINNDDEQKQETYPASLSFPVDDNANNDNNHDKFTNLFSGFRFYFVGFDENDVEKQQLSRLIRQGSGIIFWELNETITHLVLQCHHADLVLINAAKTVQNHHPFAPDNITPDWIYECWKYQELLIPNDNKNFQPQLSERLQQQKESRKGRVGTGERETMIHSNNTVAAGPNKPMYTMIKPKSAILKHKLFALLRTAPPPGAMDFCSQKLERSIVSNSGIVLKDSDKKNSGTGRILSALRADIASQKQPEQQRQQQEQQTKRRLFVIVWGGLDSQVLNVHTLLSTIKREEICEIVPVTPIWLKTVLSTSTWIEPPLITTTADDISSSTSVLSSLFIPPSWSMRKVTAKAALCVVMTGFHGPMRSAIATALSFLQVRYTEALSKGNTHLIAQKEKGPKYEKALEWGIPVVSVDWLYHLLQYGYEKGSENKFLMGHNMLKEKKRENLPTEIVFNTTKEIDDETQMIAESQF